jgi:hypothetical protein
MLLLIVRTNIVFTISVRHSSQTQSQRGQQTWLSGCLWTRTRIRVTEVRVLRLDSQLISDTTVFGVFADANWIAKINLALTGTVANLDPSIIGFIIELDPILCVNLIKLETTEIQASRRINGSQALALLTALIGIANDAIEVVGLHDLNVFEDNGIWPDQPIP